MKRQPRPDDCVLDETTALLIELRLEELETLYGQLVKRIAALEAAAFSAKSKSGRQTVTFSGSRTISG